MLKLLIKLFFRLINDIKGATVQLPALVKPLDSTLLEAGLLSTAQLEVIRHDQQEYDDLLLGEILVLHGWVTQKTIDFFMQEWPQLAAEGLNRPLRHYLQRAGILSEAQISEILNEQARLGLPFGEIAITKSWLKRKTLNFFLRAKRAADLENHQVKETNCSSEIIQIVADILKNGEITRAEQYRFFSASLKAQILTPEEQSCINEVFSRLNQGRLRLVG
ncbi:MAG: hypothetical protein HC890_02770 [Chloroflexaceae bacterium]|nr:hypothetical protein [Chloroflexaceae bacterium]